MLDIPSLERRWLRYKIKKYLPFLSIILISISITAIYYLYEYNIRTTSHIAHTKAPTKEKSKTIKQEPIREQEVILEPSMDFIQSLDTISDPLPVQPSIESTTIIKKNQPSVHSIPEEIVLNSIQPVTPKPSKTISEIKPISSSIVKRDQSPLNINELENRFQSSPNANLGVFIAKYHYDHGNYAESYNYALKTNAINNKIDDSWIIFSKSLIKLGKIDQAKKTLQLYISQSNSENARSLLNSLEKEPK